MKFQNSKFQTCTINAIETDFESGALTPWLRLVQMNNHEIIGE